MNTYPLRTPWPADFPDVIVHCELRARNAHPTYKAAKAGDITAAQQLVDDLLSPDSVKAIAQLIGSRHPLVVPVAALERWGFNAIPDEMAQVLSAELGLQMAPYDLSQLSYVAHTRANGWHRLVTPAVFAGTVIQGADYLLVDDHVGFGGTLANLRGYIEVNGGHVIGMTTLTETGGGRKIAVLPETLFMLQKKHGDELNHFWRQVFRYGTYCLTNIEAGYLYRVESFAAINTRMAEAATDARGQGIPAIRLNPRPQATP
ncbi:MAG: hypothetical protein P4L55_21400 [Syntrophobacteraceae bacterium]|nr:hypothetical protein [Syntrophobacteraceae bacterium]